MFRRASFVILATLSLVLGSGSVASAETAAEIDQFGTSALDYASEVELAPASGHYVAGETVGQLTGPNQGFGDSFVRRYDASGAEVWTRQFGSSQRDFMGGLAVDPSGVYAGRMPYPNVAVDKLDHAGDPEWSVLISAAQTIPNRTGVYTTVAGLAADGSAVYVVGSTEGVLPGQTHIGDPETSDAYVAKYDTSGNLLWTRQFGTEADDGAAAVAVDATGVYITGETWGAFPGFTKSWLYEEVFLRKYDLDGTELWTRQFTTVVSGGRAHGNDVVATDGQVYLVGETHGALAGQTSAGQPDAFIRAYDQAGSTLWTHQFGGPDDDWISAVSADSGGVSVVGQTWGGLPGQPDGGLSFLRRYTTSGGVVFTRQYGPGEALDVVSTPTETAITGMTTGALPGQTNHGSVDAYFIKVVDGSPSDATPPTVTCGETPTMFLNEWDVNLVSGVVADAGSGPLSTTLARRVASNVVGDRSTPLRGGDWAGNLTTVSCPYRVIYQVFFGAAVRDRPVVNVAKAKKPVLLDWVTWDFQFTPVSDPAHFVGVSARSIDCPAGAEEHSASRAKKSGLVHDGEGRWSYGWVLPTKGCYEVDLLLADGEPRTLLFRLT